MASGFSDMRPWESNDTALEQLAQPSPRIEKIWILREPIVEKLAETGFSGYPTNKILPMRFDNYWVWQPETGDMAAS